MVAEAQLTEALMPFRPSLDEICRDDLHLTDSFDESVLKGRIGEALVRKWLERAPVQPDEGFPRRVGSYSIAKTANGISVWNGTTPIHEFDCLFFYEGQPYIGEVKSMKVGPLHKMIESSLRIGEEIYGQPVKLVIFTPLYGGKKEYKRFVEERFHNVICVDLGYTKHDLHAATKRLSAQ